MLQVGRWISIMLLMLTIPLAQSVFPGGVTTAPNQKSGSLKGVVLDAETGAPLAGASVQIVGTQRGIATDPRGEFRIAVIPVGSYAIRINSIGYDPLTQTDVIIRAGRATSLEAKLFVRLIEVEGQTVDAGYFNDAPTEPTSSTRFSAEEVRRAPGSAGDVSRIMFSLPSVAKVNDQVNNLIVRGGSPTENSFYLDNIEIPNINHYPLFGTSGGPISLINTDFVKDVTFSAGGFSAAYGDRLSSVMSLSFREGNRDEVDLQTDLNFAGFGVIGEGPIKKERGSWLLSVRRSYLDLLVDAIGTGVVPRYSDYQGKLVYDLSPRHQISALGVLGVDYINFDREDAIDEGNVTDGWSDGYEYAVGANWRFLWDHNGYSNTSLSYLATRIKANYFETSTGKELVRQNNLDGSAQLRNVNFYRINDHHEIEFGIDAKYELDNFDHYASDYTGFFGDSIPPLVIDDQIHSPKLGGFFSYIVQPLNRLSLTLGARYDYYDYTGNGAISPRTALSYRLSDRIKLNAAFGVYNQTLPIVLLSQQESNRYLKDPQAFHYILGFEQMLTDNTRLRIEGYYKWYRNFPMSADEPQLFIIDEMIYSNYFFYHPNLRDNGKARSYGVEATVQKKLKAGVYGLLSGAWFRSQYRDLNNVWRNRVFDNRVILSAEGGYKPNEKWDFSLRWVFAGGAPYTPLDLDASRSINRSVYDQSRVNESRYSDYHSLNLRVDRRFNFTSSNMIIYFSVWNAYNRSNVASYYWNENERKPDEIMQWSLLPIFGIEFEF
jgi:hypothetical protein